MHQTCRVNILTNDLGILSPPATGLEDPIQVVRMVVTCGEVSRVHVVVNAAAWPWLLPANEQAVRNLFPEAFVSCVRADVPGAATLSCPIADEKTMCAAAAAAATLKRSWGWDESPTIRVRFAAVGMTVAANPCFEGNAWSVSCQANNEVSAT